MNLLLDTAAFIWLINGAHELTPAAREAIQRSVTVNLSIVSLWEMQIKDQNGKLRLPDPPRQLARIACPLHHILIQLVEPDDIFMLEQLPMLHADPFDRLLVAQAMEHDMVIVTPDRFIRQYPVNTLW